MTIVSPRMIVVILLTESTSFNLFLRSGAQFQCLCLLICQVSENIINRLVIQQAMAQVFPWPYTLASGHYMFLTVW